METETVLFEELTPGMCYKDSHMTWEILSFPVAGGDHPQHGPLLSVRALATFRAASYNPRVVVLSGYAHDELEVSL